MPIEDTVVGDRVRADLGDLKPLDESTETLGLIRQKTTKARRILQANPHLSDREVSEQAGCAAKLATETRRYLEELGLIPRKKKVGSSKSEELRDQLGTVVPDELRDLLGDPFLINTADRLAHVKSELRSLRRSIVGKAAAWQWLQFDVVVRQLEAVGEAIKSPIDLLREAIPHCVCPACNGQMKSQEGPCPACRGYGWLPSARLDELQSLGTVATVTQPL